MNLPLSSSSLMALAAAVMLPSCASCWKGGIPLRPGEVQALSQAAAEVGEAREVKVYQGLAHPQKEKALYRRQLRDVPHFMNHGFAFASKPADVSSSTVRRVLDLYADPASNQALSRKDVCRFHPDYALIWKSSKGEHILHICYGCHEWRYFCERGVFSSDINEPAYFDKLTRWMPAKPL